MPRSGGFTGELWSHITEIYAEILAHPFIRGLTDGSLDRGAFKFYIVQDALYLREYARALSICAAKAPEEQDIAMFNEHASGAIEVERELHRTFLKSFRMSQKAVNTTPMAPTNRAYTSYLLSVVYGRPFYEGLAAVLPCYWIYWEVGKALIRKGTPDTLYQRWIDTYGGEAFGQIVRAVLNLTDRVVADLNPGAREAMVEHFVTTSRYEWMFWDMGYRQEQWPV
ncbi:MAG: thiaminase II [bacterium]|nr:thiaminase II [bacterium]